MLESIISFLSRQKSMIISLEDKNMSWVILDEFNSRSLPPNERLEKYADILKNENNRF